MFKLVVLSALLAVAAARPGLIESPVVYSAAPAALHTVQEHSFAHVGAVVKSIPTAVSHQSQSIVHSSAHVVEDVVAPVVKTTSYAAPAPLVHATYAAAAPAVHTYAAAPVHTVNTVGSPLLHTTYGAHVAHAPLAYAAAPVTTYGAVAHHAPLTYAAAPVATYAAASPLSYTATGVW